MTTGGVQSLPDDMLAKKVKRRERYVRTKPTVKPVPKKTTKNLATFEGDTYICSKMKGKSCVSPTLDHSLELLHQPRPSETKQIYKMIFSIIAEPLGNPPHDVLSEYTKDILAVMKTNKTEGKKKEEVLLSIGPMSKTKYDLLSGLCGQIIDPDGDKQLQPDSTTGLNVQSGLGEYNTEKIASDAELLERLEKLTINQTKGTVQNKKTAGLGANKANLFELKKLTSQPRAPSKSTNLMPEGAVRKYREGAEIVHLPALKPKPLDAAEVRLFAI